MPNAVAVWKCVDSAIQRMATFTGGQTTVSAYLRLQTERINYGELIIQKTSEDGKKSGFTFKVTRDTDNWSVTVKTDDNGTAKISELPVFRGGTSTLIQYTVTEINTPSSYRQPKPQTITLTAKSSVTVQFENTLIRGTLEICKVDADGKTPLAGAVFEIMDSDKNVIATETTGKDGKITVSDLRSGYYREISAPQGYELDSTVYPFTVEKDRQIIQIVRKNTPSAGSVSIRKITPDGKTLNDVSFLLQYSIDGGTAWSPICARKEADPISVGSCTSEGISDGVLTTGEDGKVTFNGLQVKNQNVTVLYRITEVRTKNGFQLLGEPLFEGSLPQAVIDTGRKASVSLYKYDFTSAHADGVLGDNTYISTGYADENVENTLMPYAIEGVVFSYAKIADLAVHAETKDGEHQNMLLYKLPGGDKTTALMNCLDLTSENAYKTDRGDLYFTSDTLIDALSNHLNTAESRTKNALEAFIRQNGTSMPETDSTGHTSAAELEQGLYAGIRRHRQPERSHLNVVAHQHGVFGHFNGRLPFLRVRIKPLKAVLG